MKILLFVALTLSACLPVVAVDSGPQAIETGDVTGILSGCGQTASVGYLFCRYPEGWAPLGEVLIAVPPVKCGLDACASVVVFRPDGSRAVERTVPEGQTFIIVPWRSLVGDAVLDKRQRGFWPVLVQWWWLNDDGLLERAAAEAEIRLRVYSSAHSPLGAEPSRWRWSHATYVFRATEKGRMSATVK